MSIDGKSISEYQTSALVSVKNLYESKIEELKRRINDIIVELERRTEIKPIKISYKNLIDLDSRIRKKLCASGIVYGVTSDEFYKKKYFELIKSTILNPSKISKKMLNELSDWNYHLMENAISELQKTEIVN